ncbi:hypothetical protein YC2023_017532 [Brassica napus]
MKTYSLRHTMVYWVTNTITFEIETGSGNSYYVNSDLRGRNSVTGSMVSWFLHDDTDNNWRYRRFNLPPPRPDAVAKTETKPLSSREDGDDQKRERRRCSGDCMRRRAGGGELWQGHLECEEPLMKKVRMEVVWKRRGHDLLWGRRGEKMESEAQIVRNEVPTDDCYLTCMGKCA